MRAKVLALDAIDPLDEEVKAIREVRHVLGDVLT